MVLVWAVRFDFRGKISKSKRDAISIHKKSHSNDWIRPMFFILAIFFVATFFFDFEVIIGAIVIQDFWIAMMHKIWISIKFFLDVIRFLCHNRKSTINILQRIFLAVPKENDKKSSCSSYWKVIGFLHKSNLWEWHENRKWIYDGYECSCKCYPVLIRNIVAAKKDILC